MTKSDKIQSKNFFVEVVREKDRRASFTLALRSLVFGRRMRPLAGDYLRSMKGTLLPSMYCGILPSHFCTAS